MPEEKLMDSGIHPPRVHKTQISSFSASMAQTTWCAVIKGVTSSGSMVLSLFLKDSIICLSTDNKSAPQMRFNRKKTIIDHIRKNKRTDSEIVSRRMNRYHSQ